MSRRPALGLALLAVGLLASLMLAALFGSTSLSPARLWAALTGASVHSTDPVILWQLRLPRALLAAVVGAQLALSGAALQALFRNPLADPSVLGVSSGGALGAALCLVLGLSSPAIGASLGAAGALTVLLALSRGALQRDLSLVLLVGIGLGLLLSALLSLTLLSAQERAPDLYLWLLGSLAGQGWGAVGWSALCLALGGALLLSLSRALDVLGLGPEQVHSLGLPAGRISALLIAASALLVGGATAFAGLIGFVGLIVPQAVRLWTGPRHRRLLPASALTGACVLVLADLLARWLPPRELPVGVVTSLIGGPIFLWLLRRSLLGRRAL